MPASAYSDQFPWDKVDAAKRYLYLVKPWWARFGERLKIVPVYQPAPEGRPYGSITSTDGGFRLYIDTAFASWAPLHLLAGAIEHEFQHHTRDSWNRLTWLSLDEWREWANIAFDLEINGGIEHEASRISMEKVRALAAKSHVFVDYEMDFWSVTEPPRVGEDGWLPRLLGLPDRLSAEEYLKILQMAKQDPPPTPPAPGSEDEEPDGPGEEEPDGASAESGGDPEGHDDDDQQGDSAGSGSDGPNGGDESQQGPQDPSQDGEESEGSDAEQEDDPSSANDSGGSPEEDSGDDEGPGSDGADADAGADAEQGSGDERDSDEGQEVSPSEGDQQSPSGTEQSGGASPSDRTGDGRSSEQNPGEGQPTDGPSDGQPKSLAETLADLKSSGDRRMWSAEIANPRDELIKPAWKPDDRRNEKALDRASIEGALIELEEDVRQYAKDGPDVFGLHPGANMLQWAAKRRRTRGVDWQSKLNRLLSSNFNSAKTHGASDLSYAVRNPNQPEFGVILQGLHDYAPTITVLQDVSGSMIADDGLNKAMSAFTDLCSKVLGRFNTPVTWVTVDAGIIDVGTASAWTKHQQKRWSYGFGGTDIAPAIEQVMTGKLVWEGRKYPKADLTVICTDCVFEWPKRRPLRNGKVLVVSVEPDTRKLEKFLPDWLDWRRELVVIDD